MSGHTPGPWRWFAGDHVETSRPHIKHFVGANGQGFALTVGLHIEEDAANAHLIAAAPELLEALKAIPCADCERGIRDSISMKLNDCRTCQPARAAIAKAEGRQE